jgi:regulator of cell morphogenesis and NO signaling
MEKEMTIGEIVALDFRAAEIFKHAGIDFCCGGKKSIGTACSELGISKDDLMLKLEELKSTPNTSTNKFNEWETGFLCDYIVNTHHKYVLRTLPDLVGYTTKIAAVHGDNHPELKDVAEIFSRINTELLQHLRNEEEVLFPSIKEVLKSGSENAKTKIKSEIERMSGEHEFAGGAMDRINVITSGYSVPADGCNTYQVTFRLLAQFEDDLHTHVHLENNILYPKALELTN